MNMTLFSDWPFDLTVIGGILATYLIHSSVIFLIVWPVSRLSIFTNPRYQQFLWKAALLGGILTAFCGHLLPEYTPELKIQLDSPAFREVAAVPTPVNSGMDIQAKSENAMSKGYSGTHPFLNRQFIFALLLSFWIFGALFLIARECILHKRFLRSIDPRLLSGPGFQLRTLEELVQSSGLSRFPKLTFSGKLRSPIVIAGREICLPERATSLAPEEQRSLIAHELAHVYRKDYYWQIMIQTIKHLFFFQPLNRIIAARIQDNTELLCDAWAVNQKINSVFLASSLVEIAAWVTDKPGHYFTQGLALHRNSLRNRIIQLLNANNMKTQLPFYPLLFAGVILVFFLIAWSSPTITINNAGTPGENNSDPIEMTRRLDPGLTVQDTVPKKEKASKKKLEKAQVELEEKMHRLAEEQANKEIELHEKIERQNNVVMQANEKMVLQQQAMEELHRSLEREQQDLQVLNRELVQKQRAVEERTRTINESAKEMENVLRKIELEMKTNSEIMEKQAIEMEAEARKMEEQMRLLEAEMKSVEEEMQNRLKSFEAELKEMLISDKILAQPEAFESIEFDNDQLRINGKLIPDRLQTKYIELLNKYFDLDSNHFRYNR